MIKKMFPALFIGLVLFPGILRAQEAAPVGTVSSLEGVVDAQRGSSEPVLLKQKGAGVFLHDRIRTKSYSKAEIVLSDGSIMRLAPNTCVYIEEFRLDAWQRREMARIKLTRGEIETIVSPTGKPETFLIETPNAAGAVKGSDIFAFYQAGQSGFLVADGELSVTNQILPGKVTVLPGNLLTVPLDGAVSPARPYSERDIARHQKEVEHTLKKKWVPAEGSSKVNAVITSLSGTVRVYPRGGSDWRAARQDDVVSEGDKLQTAAESRAEIRLSNGNIIFLQADTEFSIDALRYDAGTDQYEERFAMTRGKVTGLVQKLNPDSKFEVRTPTLVCGVRGTYFAVFGERAGAAQVFFEGGNGFVQSVADGRMQDINPGQFVSVDAAGIISTPLETPAELRNAIMQPLIAAPALSTLVAPTAGFSSGQQQQQQGKAATGKKMGTASEAQGEGSAGEGEGSSGEGEGSGEEGSSGEGDAKKGPPPDGKGPPPPGMGPPPPPGMGPPPPGGLPFPPPIDGMVPPPPIGIPFYDSQNIGDKIINLKSDYAFVAVIHSTSGTVAGMDGFLDLKLHNDQTWTGIINGHYTQNIGSPWAMQFHTLNGDNIDFVINGPLSTTAGGTWDVATGSFSGVIGSQIPPKIMTVTEGSGVSTAAGGAGDISGSASGTWAPQGVITP